MLRNNDILEIRWHGRAGQGVVTAAETLAEILAREGKFVQAFPNFGAEKRGAPISAYNRISSKPITIHQEITNPKIVVVTDPTLLGLINFAEGTPDDGIIITNSTLDPAYIKEKLKLHPRKVYSIDAYKIANEEIGRPIPNIPMLAALFKVTGMMEMEKFKERVRASLEKKLKKEVVEANLRTIERAYKEVKGS